MNIIQQRISRVPSKTGIYFLKGQREKILYVGKAKNLRNRLRSYFRKSPNLGARKSAMVQETIDFGYIITENELEAFVLEANLIKQHRPKFNVVLRDDKNYPYLKLTTNEIWPRLEVVRRMRNDKALYFGPYVPASSMWETLAFIRNNFPIRDCKLSLEKRLRPCIQHQMGRCVAPCAGMITREEYLKIVNEVKLFLSGRNKDLIWGIQKRMQEFSEQMKFEEAAKIRDKIKAIEQAWRSQKVIDPRLGDIDVIGVHRNDSMMSLNVLFVRNGIMLGSKDYSLKKSQYFTDKELLYTFLTQFYSKEIIPPPKIITQILPEDTKLLENWLSTRKGKQVKIQQPKSGRKKDLIDMASENARLNQIVQRDIETDELLADLKEKLVLEKTPESIGAFDVSTISGNEPVGAFIVWQGGDFQKDMYRKLRIKTVKGIDDYSMMEEIIGRIIKKFQGILPDLLIIDGGKGHLETARKAIEKNIGTMEKPVQLIAVAKDPDRAYLTTSEVPVDLEDQQKSSLLLQKIRNEAHRFAITYHRKLRAKGLLRSPLENIQGIGKKKRLELLRVFGSIENIRASSVEEIAKTRGFHRSLAEKLVHELRRIA
jgi:excinuclease ABC subunit C